MKKKILTLLALLMAVSGAWAQTYTVTFSGDYSGSLNKAFNNVTMPYSFSAVNGINLSPWNVIAGEAGSYTNVYVSSGGEGKVSVSYTWNNMTITISGAFEGTATIHCDGEGDEEGISRDVYVTCVENRKVSVKEGTEDATSWTITPAEATTTGVAAGTAVSVKYNGTKHVKSVKAVKKVPAATVTTAPTGAAVVGVGKTTALVSGGAADGGTLMYAVTTTYTQPTSTAGFSASVPTAQTITASGKVYVWYYVKADDTHTDSEIAVTEVPVADIVWDATNVNNLYVSGTVQPYEKEGVTLSGNANHVEVQWYDLGNPEWDGMGFGVHESGGFTFTAPAGKAFTRIEMKPLDVNGWFEANLGTGWALPWDNPTTVTWTGSAASTVGLLTDVDNFVGAYISYIAFYLSE